MHVISLTILGRVPLSLISRNILILKMMLVVGDGLQFSMLAIQLHYALQQLRNMWLMFYVHLVYKEQLSSLCLIQVALSMVANHSCRPFLLCYVMLWSTQSAFFAINDIMVYMPWGWETMIAILKIGGSKHYVKHGLN